MAVAPNSPSARAQVITAPAISARLARGTVILKKVRIGPAPRVAEAILRSRGTASKPERACLT